MSLSVSQIVRKINLILTEVNQIRYDPDRADIPVPILRSVQDCSDYLTFLETFGPWAYQDLQRQLLNLLKNIRKVPPEDAWQAWDIILAQQVMDS